VLNSSLDSNNQSLAFHKDAIFKTEPHDNINEDMLESFIFFRDRISGMITTETTALKKMEGSNLEVINEFRSKYGHYRERLKEFEAVRERQQELKRIIDQLKDERLGMFREGFGLINAKLKEVYQHLTRGGDA
jgi:chromosome segregation ATPase